MISGLTALRSISVLGVKFEGVLAIRISSIDSGTIFTCFLHKHVPHNRLL